MFKRASILILSSILLVGIHFSFAQEQTSAPAPLLTKGQPVQWWFVYKFGATSFPGSGDETVKRTCSFGGKPTNTTTGDQFVYASNINPILTKGDGPIGDNTGTSDPLGATFDEIYHGNFNYVVWNDQSLVSVQGANCGGYRKSCSAPWGHSKGILAWNNDGDGLILQVTTPGWPVSGGAKASDGGDTLGCYAGGNNNLLAAQHFFALQLNKNDVVFVLEALKNASVVTSPNDLLFVHNGGPEDIQAIVSTLGVKSKSTTPLIIMLSSNIELISKPSNLNVPPWQLVSAELGGVPLRTATWWMTPAIPSTTDKTQIDCFSSDLGTPGEVEIAQTGNWGDTNIKLVAPSNHAKLGVSLDSSHPITIFGDENQQGVLSGKCDVSQNGRGGLFFVVDNKQLWQSVSSLLKGETAPAYDAEGNARATATPASQ